MINKVEAIFILFIFCIGIFSVAHTFGFAIEQYEESIKEQPIMIEQAKTEIMENIQQGKKTFIIAPYEKFKFHANTTNKIIEYGTSKGLSVVEVVQDGGAVVFEAPSGRS